MENVVNIATPGFQLPNPPDFNFVIDIDRFEPPSDKLLEFIEAEAAGMPEFISSLMRAEAHWIAAQKELASYIIESVGQEVDHFVVYLAPTAIYYGGMLVIKQVLDLYLTTVRKYQKPNGRVKFMLINEGDTDDELDFIQATFTGSDEDYEIVNI